MTPIVNGLEEEFAGQAEVVRLNANERPNLRLQELHGVRGHPSFVVLNGDEEVTERFFGPQEAATLRAALVAAVP